MCIQTLSSSLATAQGNVSQKKSFCQELPLLNNYFRTCCSDISQTKLSQPLMYKDCQMHCLLRYVQNGSQQLAEF